MTSHKQLTEHGKNWLLSAKGCNPVFCERGSAKLSEIPNVIGWSSNECYVLECKISKADFLADFKKEHRNNGGLGVYRYYLIPNELYESIKDEERNGWGLVVYFEGRGFCQQVRYAESKVFERDLKSEVFYLRSRILQIQRFGL